MNSHVTVLVKVAHVWRDEVGVHYLPVVPQDEGNKLKSKAPKIRDYDKRIRENLLGLMQGTAYVYEVVLRPIVAKHETDIDRKLMELKARAWDLVAFYWQYCAKFGQTTFVQMLQFLATQSARVSYGGGSEVEP